MGELPIYIILGIVSIGSAIGLLLSRNAVHGALFLVLNFGVAAIFYFMMNAPFLGVIQISVYAGAIMVLFIFVIMLLGAERLAAVDTGARIRASRFVLIACVSVLVISVAYAVLGQSAPALASAAPIDSSPLAIGMRLFNDYTFPFEVVSILLLVAMVGSVVLARSK